MVVTNPGGQQGTLTGGYSFVPVEAFSATASPSLVTSGGQLTMSWVAPSGRGCNGGGDWVALYRVGDPDDTGAANGHSDLWFQHVCGAASGTSTLSAPPQPGQVRIPIHGGQHPRGRTKRPGHGHGLCVTVGPDSNIERRWGDIEQPSDRSDVLVHRQWLYGGPDGDTVHQPGGERVDGADTDVDF